jgi:nitrous oxide reductase accessory protein NosL
MRRGVRTFGALLLAAVLLVAAAVAADQPPVPGPGEKCPVCGMFIARHPEWMAVLQERESAPLFFCGPKDLFKFIRAPGGHQSDKDSAVVYVRDYYRLSFIDALHAFYVTGSDVLSSMGHELIPLATREDADEFMWDHDGRRIVTYDEVSPQVLKELE